MKRHQLKKEMKIALMDFKITKDIKKGSVLRLYRIIEPTIYKLEKR